VPSTPTDPDHDGAPAAGLGAFVARGNGQVEHERHVVAHIQPPLGRSNLESTDIFQPQGREESVVNEE